MNLNCRHFKGHVFFNDPICESLIDFAQSDLDLHVWNKDASGQYKLLPAVEKAIAKFIKSYPERDLLAETGIVRVIGSITSNQYVEDTDIDVHLIPRDLTQWTEKEQWAVKKWFDENRDRLGAYIEEHPIEIFVQINPAQDLLSVGVYLAKDRTWVKGPKITPEDYDPYDDFSNIADDLKNSVEDADLLIGELKRDVIDFETIQKAVSKMSPEAKKKFLTALEAKLQEIEDDIQALYSKRKEWVDARRDSSKPEDPEQALHDVELARQWKDTDAMFKFINRYQYLATISDLRKVVADDGEVSSDEINTIKGIVGAK